MKTSLNLAGAEPGAKTDARRPRSSSLLSKTPSVAASAPDLAAQPFNIRAPAYIFASGRHRCWKCSGEIAVHALAVAPPFERLDGLEQWQPGAKLAILSYVESLPERIVAHLARVVPWYFRDESQWHLKPYWMNHCEHCGAKIGDYETIESAAAPFDVGMFGSSDVKFLDVPEPFEAVALLIKS